MRFVLRPIFALVALLALSLPTLAADRAMLILDASGSMWAQIDGTSRIEIARDTLKQVLAGVPTDLELGFMAYGHRSKGDCADIEMLVDPAPGTADAISAAADRLSPKGKTPLSAAVKQAAEALKYTEDKATVVLITDGIETCDADPCALASELEKAGVDFTVNVVGFGLTKEEGAAVQCLADNTGGKYISAKDGAALKAAIEAAVTNSPPPPPAAPEPAPEPASDITFAPTAVLTEGGDALVDGDGNIAWEFAKANSDGSAGDWVRTEYGNTYTGAIEPGDYIVTAKLDYSSVQQRVTIEAGKIARPQFDLEAGHIVLRPIASEGGAVDDSAAVYTEFPDGTSTTSYGQVSSYVPAGEIKIEVTIGSAKLADSITVVAGERASKDIVVGVGHATVNAYYVKDMRVEEGGLFSRIVSAKADIQGTRADIASTYGPDGQFDLMPGDYVAIESFDAATVEQAFTVKAGEAQAINVVLEAGVLAINAPNATNIEVFGAKKDIQGNRQAFGNAYDVTANRTLPAGDYHIVVTLADDSKKEADASVKAGERTELTIQ